MKINVPKLQKLDEIGSCTVETRLKVERQVKDWLEDIGIDTEHSIRNLKIDYNPAYHFWDIHFYKNNIVTDDTNKDVREDIWRRVKNILIENESNLKHLDLHRWQWEYRYPTDEQYDEDLYETRRPTPGVRLWIDSYEHKVNIEEIVFPTQRWRDKNPPNNIVTIRHLADQHNKDSFGHFNPTIIYTIGDDDQKFFTMHFKRLLRYFEVLN